MYSFRYGSASSETRSIVFTQTKKEADELALDPTLKVEAKALHGDIPQGQREKTLEAFRTGTLRCLVATDVAARGLDIKSVELVVQMEPPRKNFSGKADHET